MDFISMEVQILQDKQVCNLCGKVIPVDTCPLSELEETLQQKTGFRITGHSLEFTGLCPECSKKNTDEK